MKYTYKSSGKVRDIYESEDGKKIILVASDRVSAFDRRLGVEIPGKGEILTAISAFWCNWMKHNNAFFCSNVDNPPLLNPFGRLDEPEFNTPEFIGRCTKMEKLKMFPIECIVRGHMFGSLWTAYQQGQYVFCGKTLPRGLKQGDELEPIFTPTTKAPEGQHDENITFDQMVEILHASGYGREIAEEIRANCLDLYKQAYQYALERRLVLADTKFELGMDQYGRVAFGDELLTPDSSRYWYLDDLRKGKIVSCDKQPIRDYLAAEKARGNTDPQLPPEIIHLTACRYANLLERLTGYYWDKND